MKAIEEQFKNWNRNIDDDMEQSDKEQKSIDATTKKLKEVDKDLIDDFMKGLIEFLEKKEREKHK